LIDAGRSSGNYHSPSIVMPDALAWAMLKGSQAGSS
jgi:hypothetical protein